ncbi:MAG: DUF4402 domain-containing protein [Erythrobacter sp.]
MGKQDTSQEGSRGRARGKLLLAAILTLAVGPAPALAVPPTISIVNPLYLRFGTFAVPASGFREVSPSGGVTSSGIFALGNGGTGPARFTVQYDRGNNSRRRLDIVVDLVFSTPPAFSQPGLNARLSRYQTDLPGYGLIAPGQAVRVEMRNCVQRTCSMSFNLGGRLDIDRSFGGGIVEIPVPVDAVLISDR